MILTGKAKDNFYSWLFNNSQGNFFGDINDAYDFFSYLPLSGQYALIIEWFDSVGIYIEILFDKVQEKQETMKWWFNINSDNFDIKDYDSRQEATKQAILKANEIYNARHLNV